MLGFTRELMNPFRAILFVDDDAMQREVLL